MGRVKKLLVAIDLRIPSFPLRRLRLNKIPILHNNKPRFSKKMWGILFSRNRLNASHYVTKGQIRRILIPKYVPDPCWRLLWGFEFQKRRTFFVLSLVPLMRHHPSILGLDTLSPKKNEIQYRSFSMTTLSIFHNNFCLS